MFDVIVVGGGPGGSTAATLLAQRKLRVLLLEKERFPRFQIGESLLPYNNDVFERLGVSEQLEHYSFVPKHGATFLTADGSLSYSFSFGRNLPPRYAQARQVRRDEFDHLLLRHAAASGVEVREQTAVRSVDLSDPRKALVVVRNQTGGEERIEGRFLVDASGHSALIASQQKSKKESESLQKVSFFGHYENVAAHQEGERAGDTVVVILRNGWFWLIPLGEGVMSVGLVSERDEYKRSGMTPEAFLKATIGSTPFLASRMVNAKLVGPIRSRKDFSYQVSRLTGPNFALIGDAAGFIDPIFSTGVYMAMKSGEIVADALSERLASGSTRQFRRYEGRFRSAYQKYLRFVSNFYRREFIEVFLQPSDRFGLFPVIVGVLAGSVFDKRVDRFRLGLFFGLVRLQKMFGFIAPRIAWDKLPETARS